jgi:hypothetical protein
LDTFVPAATPAAVTMPTIAAAAAAAAILPSPAAVAAGEAWPRLLLRLVTCPEHMLLLPLLLLLLLLLLGLTACV